MLNAMMNKLDLLNKIRIVLVETTHPGNIGATARAMKTMGLQRLYLVSPHYFPHEEAIAMASGSDVLDHLLIFNSLESAIADCALVIGTSARSRTLPWTVQSPQESAILALTQAQQHEVAIVFGQEKAGLTNAQLAMCQFHVQIPCDLSYSSLNIAAAVQVIAYELRKAALGESLPTAELPEYASVADLERFFEHVESTLTAVKFLKPANSEQVLRRIRRLFQRARLETEEVRLLRGVLSACQKKVGKGK